MCAHFEWMIKKFELKTTTKKCSKYCFFFFENSSVCGVRKRMKRRKNKTKQIETVFNLTNGFDYSANANIKLIVGQRLDSIFHT